MKLSFENQVALVTGAGSGMGLATAQAFAAEGAAVVLADVNEAAVQKAAKQLIAAGHKAIAARCDVADEAQVETMVEQTVSTFGRLDAAFNNAGVQSPVAETADASGEDFDRVIAINLRGVWNCMKYELRQMRKQGSGAHRQQLFARRTRGHCRAGRVSCLQARGARAYEERGSRICLDGRSHQRDLPGDHQYPDGLGHAGYSSGSDERADERSADWATWSA